MNTYPEHTPSWDEFGEKLTDYRHCIQHYIPIGLGFADAMMLPLQGNIWSVTFLIPDNPDVRSKSRFQYDSQIDALTYGWSLANEIRDIAKLVIDIVPKRE